MTNIFLPACNSTTSIAAGATAWFSMGTADNAQTGNEANFQVTFQANGTLSNMYCRVATNATTGSSTLTSRKNTANGNQTVSIGSAATGEFQDTTHTDSVSAGNLLSYQIINGGGGALGLVINAIQFAPTTTTNTINRLISNAGLADTSIGTNYYNPVSGSPTNNTTEANAQFKNKVAATLQNLYVFVATNTLAIATVKSRISAATGNLVVSIGSGVTGAIEDTAHTDSIVSGNLINTIFNATATTNLIITMIAMDHLTTTSQTHYLMADSTGGTINAATTNYSSLSGDTVFSGTELNTQLKTGIAFSASNLEAFVISNGITATSTIKFRRNGINGNQGLSYKSGVTGYMEDVVNVDSVGSSTEINYQYIAGGTGTSMVIGNTGIFLKL